jgi:hypothetical protein
MKKVASRSSPFFLLDSVDGILGVVLAGAHYLWQGVVVRAHDAPGTILVGRWLGARKTAARDPGTLAEDGEADLADLLLRALIDELTANNRDASRVVEGGITRRHLGGGLTMSAADSSILFQ